MIFVCGSIGLLFASLAVAEDKRESIARQRGVYCPRRRIQTHENYHSSDFVESLFTGLGLIYKGPVPDETDFHKIEVPDSFNVVSTPVPKGARFDHIYSLWTNSTLSQRPDIEPISMMLTLAGNFLPVYNPVCKIVVSQRSVELFGDNNYHMVDPYAYLSKSQNVFGDFQVVAYAHTTAVFTKTCSSDANSSTGANDVFLLYEEAERALDKITPGWQPYTALWR